MTEKQTLGEILQGRTIESMQNKNGEMSLGFTDGSTMTIGTGYGSLSDGATGGTVRNVQQTETSLHLELVNGKSLTMPLPTDETMILLQSKDGNTEYKN